MRRTIPVLLALVLCGSATMAEYPEASEALGDKVTYQAGFIPSYVGEQLIYLGVGDDMLEVPFLIATTISSGGMATSHQWAQALVYFRKVGDRLMLVEKNVDYPAEGPVADAITRTYTDRVVFAFDIVAFNSDYSHYVVDGTQLFAWTPDALFGPGFSFDATLAQLQFKAFSDNIEIRYTMPAAWDGRLMTLHYSIARLPESDYVPRQADPRIGYFLSAYQDLSKGDPAENHFVRLIHRWNVKKADPSLELSPPVEPIVFYIEKTVPIRYRKAVADGLLEWNKAFEAIGITGAIEVRQQTDYNEFRDLDPADINYNFFRWITTGQAYAMASWRFNPSTGEIIDAEIVFDDSFASMTETEGALYFGDEAEHPRWKSVFERLPENHLLRQVREHEARLLEPNRLPFPMPERHDFRCEIGHGRAEQLQLARLALGEMAASPSLVQAYVKDTVMHELGHCLGLRHNFKASTWLSLDGINSGERPQAIAGSVMDYLPINIAVEREKQGAYAMETIGPYDYWAIEYGYREVEDPAELAPVLARVAEAGLTFGTDEDVSTPDPTAVRWDLGTDMISFAEQRMAIATSLWKDVVDRAVKDGESFAKARPAFQRLFFEYRFGAMQATKYVGGAVLNRDFKGDENGREPVVPVSASQQRRALALIARILEGKDFQFPPKLLRHLAAGRWDHWGSWDWLADTTFPLRDSILLAQLSCYYSVMNPWVFGELLDQIHMVEEEKPMTPFEVVDACVDNVFAEFRAPKAGSLSDFRRNLQRSVAEDLIMTALEGSYGWTPADVRAYVRVKLVDLLPALRKANDGEDAVTRAHRLDLAERIDRALKAHFVTD